MRPAEPELPAGSPPAGGVPRPTEPQAPRGEVRGPAVERLPAAREPEGAEQVPGTVVAVCRALEPVPDRPGVLTGIDKRPVAEVVVTATGVADDHVVDTRFHGGRDKAVYAYAAEDAEWWAEQLDREVGPGWFGENLVLAGVDVSGAEVGERWRVGADVLVEVTQPRLPCMTFQRRTGEQRWVKRFTAAGRPGAYLRVLSGGVVRAGDEVHVAHRPGHGVRIGAWAAHQAPADARALLAAQAAGLDLAPALVAYVEAAAART